MSDPKPKLQFPRIELSGWISLGEERKLIQGPDEDDDEPELFQTMGTGPAHEHDPVSPDDRDKLGTELEYRLSKKSKGDLYITDKGLTNSFGIFGAPGTGKTTLLLYILRQVVALYHDDPRMQFGSLILDPKAAVVDEFRNMCSDAGRDHDLIEIGTGVRPVNVIDCSLDPYELGAILVLAGRSAGIDASDPFWFQEWTNLFASTLSILRVQATVLSKGWRGHVQPVTLKSMLDAIFEEVPANAERGLPAERSIQRIARNLMAHIDAVPEESREDVRIDLKQLERFYRQEYVGTIEAFITKAFGMFRRHRNRCYSDDTPRPSGRPPFYEDIVENGRLVIIAISPSEPVLAKTLCTLVKVLFQRTVLGRGMLVNDGVITNLNRPVIMACDEYSEIASEVPGQSMGDGQFLALARQFGCMALFATQSVNVLEASSLRDTWRSIFGNFAAKIYMRLADNETADEAVKLAGESDWQLISKGTQRGGESSSVSHNQELRERKNLPSHILTHRLGDREAVVIGTLDGGETKPKTKFIKVRSKKDHKLMPPPPPDWKPASADEADEGKGEDDKKEKKKKDKDKPAAEGPT